MYILCKIVNDTINLSDRKSVKSVRNTYSEIIVVFKMHTKSWDKIKNILFIYVNIVLELLKCWMSCINLFKVTFFH